MFTSRISTTDQSSSKNQTNTQISGLDASETKIVPGSKVRVRIAKINKFDIIVEFIGTKGEGRVHITEIVDLAADDYSNPLKSLKVGEERDARVIGRDSLLIVYSQFRNC